MRFFVGLVLDAYGPRVASAGAALLVFIGYICMIIGPASDSELLIMSFGMFLVGFGGGSQLSVQSVCKLFPRNSSAVLGLLSAAFQVSSSGWLFFRLIYESGVSYTTMCAVFASIAFVFVIISVLLWPKAAFEGPGKERSGEKKQREISFKIQAKSKEYLMLLIFFSIHILGVQFFVGSLNDQLVHLGYSDEQVASLVTSFNSILSSACIVAPLSGASIDKFGYAQTVVVVNALLVLSNVLMLISSSYAQ